MKKIKTIIGITAVCGMLLLAGRTGMAAEQAYLHGDRNMPMILNTGGIYNDGNTGVFMDLTSIDVEDLFKNGLALKADFLRLEKGISNVYTVHFRMTDDRDAWIAQEDGWHSVNEESTKAEKMAIRFIREDMGKEERREKYMGRISAIWDEKVKALETERRKEYEKRKKTAENAEMPELKLPELKEAKPDQVVEEIKTPPSPTTGGVENLSSKETGLSEKTMEKDLADAGLIKSEQIAKPEKTEDKKETESSAAVPDEKIKATPMSVKIKGNVQTDKEAKKNENGEIVEQVEISITSDPVVKIVSGNDTAENQA